MYIPPNTNQGPYPLSDSGFKIPGSQGSSLSQAMANFSLLDPSQSFDVSSITQPELPDFSPTSALKTAGSGGLFSSSKLPGTISMGLSGLQSLGQLFASFKALSLANKQFKFQKDFSEKNLANQVSTYNTALADRSRSRAQIEGQSPEQAQAYIDKNKLTGLGGT